MRVKRESGANLECLAGQGHGPGLVLDHHQEVVAYLCVARDNDGQNPWSSCC